MIIGLHYITVNRSSIGRLNDFYSGVLGLRLLKRTGNFASKYLTKLEVAVSDARK